MRAAVFLDRDGTIIEDEGYLADASKARFVRGAVDALRTFREHGYLLVVISNQSGIPRGLITPSQHAEVDARVKAMLAADGVPLDGAYYCPHLASDGCACRKPEPGMLLQAARELGIELSRSFMVGDKLSDVAAGRAAGCMTALLGPGKDAASVPASAPAPEPTHRANDWPTLLSSMETSWKP
jgi:D-glycero-D-manno-heptose 1,7-bisphosphate phosphatase